MNICMRIYIALILVLNSCYEYGEYRDYSNYILTKNQYYIHVRFECLSVKRTFLYSKDYLIHCIEEINHHEL